MGNKFIQLQDVKKEYQTGEVCIQALKDVTFTIDKGEICVILGASGAGKTTLLNLLGGMDVLSSGTIQLEEKLISTMSKKELTSYRRHDVGFVFQFYNLIPTLTARENVEIATQICRNPMNPDEALQLMGLGHRSNHFPAQLSGGEQQRVAIARALAKNPKLLLCDEPTGALDYTTGKAILKLLQDISRKQQMTVVIITHNQAIASMADRIVHIKSGSIAYCKKNPDALPVDKIEW
ncbi:MAG TPA: macrolide ABC transporter ATP-binding protein [Clostridiales bacterium]|jgi:putative ABC transport system ATP-binding protein|nr:macrolide ABC transporter ATP-binding protein [Clostridiales bacterium]